MNVSKRMDALPKPHRNPDIDDEEPGWYYAPNGNRYYGLGTVSEKGITHDDSLYFRVRPSKKRSDGLYQFFDPLTDEDMPEECMPLPMVYATEYQRMYKLPKLTGCPKVGEESPEDWISTDNMDWRGMGRVVMCFRDSTGFAHCRVEPNPDKHDGHYRFFNIHTDRNMPDHQRPRAAYTGTPGTQCNPDRRVGVETGSVYSWFAGLPDSEYHFRKLGTEGAGWYLAPDGQNYIGVGKVIVVGVNEHGRKYHHVEPIPGKQGGGYDFFHQFTRE